MANTPDKLSEAATQNPPQSATIGSTSIIGDSSGNSIIVYGPPESKAKAKQIIDLLEQIAQTAEGKVEATAREAIDRVKRGIVAYSYFG